MARVYAVTLILSVTILIDGLFSKENYSTLTGGIESQKEVNLTCPIANVTTNNKFGLSHDTRKIRIHIFMNGSIRLGTCEYGQWNNIVNVSFLNIASVNCETGSFSVNIKEFSNLRIDCILDDIDTGNQQKFNLWPINCTKRLEEALDSVTDDIVECTSIEEHTWVMTSLGLSETATSISPMPEPRIRPYTIGIVVALTVSLLILLVIVIAQLKPIKHKVSGCTDDYTIQPNVTLPSTTGSLVNKQSWIPMSEFYATLENNRSSHVTSDLTKELVVILKDKEKAWDLSKPCSPSSFKPSCGFSSSGLPDSLEPGHVTMKENVCSSQSEHSASILGTGDPLEGDIYSSSQNIDAIDKHVYALVADKKINGGTIYQEADTCDAYDTGHARKLSASLYDHMDHNSKEENPYALPDGEYPSLDATQGHGDILSDTGPPNFYHCLEPGSASYEELRTTRKRYFESFRKKGKQIKLLQLFQKKNVKDKKGHSCETTSPPPRSGHCCETLDNAGSELQATFPPVYFLLESDNIYESDDIPSPKVLFTHQDLKLSSEDVRQIDAVYAEVANC